MTGYIAALFCVLGIVAGQFLFKMCANLLRQSGTVLDSEFIAALIAAIVLYGVTSMGWIFVLQKLELGRAYPLMAMAFVLVPIGSHFIFGEKFPPQYYYGVIMISLGVFITLRS